MPHILGAVIAGDVVWVQTVQGLVAVKHGDPGSIEPTLGVVTPSARAFVQFTGTASCVFTMPRDGPDRAQIERAASRRRSPDNRFLVATSAAGEILEWDLAASAPQRVNIDPAWLPAGVTDHAVWLTSPVDGVARVDTRTGRFDRARARSDRVRAHLSTRAGRGRRARRPLYIVDRTNDKHLVANAAAIGMNGRTGSRSRTAMEPSGGGGRAAVIRERRELGHALDTLAASHNWVGGMRDAAMGIDPTTGRVEHLPAPPGVETLQITGSGQLWLLAEHVVWGGAARSRSFASRPPVQST